LLHRYCLIFNLSVAFWSLGFFVTLFPGLPHDTALFVSRAHHAVSTFIPPLFCAFVFSLINIYEKRKKLIKFGFLFSTFLFISALTSPHFTKDVISKLYFPYWPVGGFLYFLFVVYFLIFTIYPHWELYKEYRSTSSGRKKRQIIYFFIGTAVGFIGGPTTFFLKFWYRSFTDISLFGDSLSFYNRLRHPTLPAYGHKCHHPGDSYLCRHIRFCSWFICAGDVYRADIP